MEKEQKQVNKKPTKKPELTEKQKRFIDFYVITGNATEAAIKAGYSKKTAYQIGSENLRKLDKYISKRTNKKDGNRIAKADEVMEFFTKAMRGELDEDQVAVVTYKDAEGGGFSSEAQIVKKQIAPKDRIKAAENLAKRFGLLTEKVEVTTSASDDAISSLTNALVGRKIKEAEEISEES